MKLTWDERKRLSNLDKHGLDFANLSIDFIASATIVPTKLGRFLAIGTLNGKSITVVVAPLGREGLSVISMRPSNKRERANAP